MPRARLAAAVLAALLAAACGGAPDRGGPASGGASPDGADGASPDGAAAIAVALREWEIAPAVAAASAGEIAFEAVNEGSLAHDLWVIRTDLAADALPVASGVAAAGEGGALAGRSGNVAARASARLALRLGAGRYVLICNVAGHYELGMRAAFAVR